MDEQHAVLQLSALAHRTRLAVFRLLAHESPTGLPAGDIARRLQVPPTTMSTHLSILARAELVQARRESRTIFYAVQPEGVNALMSYLWADCCGGQPSLCGDLRPALDRAPTRP
jgi:DNA-binding transcriptional ArsR family regulator